jgi:hypothetical protein
VEVPPDEPEEAGGVDEPDDPEEVPDEPDEDPDEPDEEPPLPPPPPESFFADE